MSDVLLERIAKATEGLLAHLKSGPGVVGGAAKPAAAAAPAAGKPGAAAAAVNAAKPAAGKPAPAAAAKPAAAAPAAAKAPGGKYNSEQVRVAIRAVATNSNLGKQSALDILDQDGNGVKAVKDLKPENYDAVYEACQALLSGEGEAPAAADDDLM